MRVAVYTIAKNEEQFVQRWADSCADADCRLILDTGSSDNTRLTAIDAGVTVHRKVFHPWRFDTARNHALSLIPDDIDLCIALDMDEILQPGWRQALEAVPNNTTRPRYKYVWSWNTNGSEGLVYGGDKIHSRHGYTWRHPVHEVLQPVDILEQQHWVDRLEIHHHPDPTKSRAQYFDLLKLAVKEDPDDPRNQFYLAREYFYQGDRTNAMTHFFHARMRQTWPPEKAAAFRYSYLCEGNPMDLYRALFIDPCRRETFVMLAQHYHNQQNWQACLHYAETALNIREKPLDYLCEADAWGWLPYDLAAVASYWLGDRQTARLYGERASQLAPYDDRLRQNLGWYTSP
jgi:glycosyltransferase involved in cell wall biosynthesis